MIWFKITEQNYDESRTTPSKCYGITMTYSFIKLKFVNILRWCNQAGAHLRCQNNALIT